MQAASSSLSVFLSFAGLLGALVIGYAHDRAEAQEAPGIARAIRIGTWLGVLFFVVRIVGHV